jgi:hypothetical protein
VRKLLSIGLVLALLVTFMVPVVVGACDDCTYTPPECAPLPEKTTKTMAGAAVWTMLGTMDTMGKAVCTTTALLACNLGGWSDELGIIATDLVAMGLGGLGDLVEAAIGQFVGEFDEIGTALANILRGIGEAIQQNQG